MSRMLKVEKEIEYCNDGCYYCHGEYVHVDGYVGDLESPIMEFCLHPDLGRRRDISMKYTGLGEPEKWVIIPDWCPLDKTEEKVKL